MYIIYTTAYTYMCVVPGQGENNTRKSIMYSDGDETPWLNFSSTIDVACRAIGLMCSPSVCNPAEWGSPPLLAPSWANFCSCLQLIPAECKQAMEIARRFRIGRWHCVCSRSESAQLAHCWIDCSYCQTWHGHRLQRHAARRAPSTG